MKNLALLCLVAVATFTATVNGAEPAAELAARFERDVRPVLVQVCGECHSAKKQEAGLRLDSREAMLRGGDTGPAIVPGEPDKSLIVRAIRRTGELKMPPERKLRDDQIAALTQWVKSGAVWPASANESNAAKNVTRGGLITDDERRHWSFQPVRRSPAPQVSATDWPHSPIDYFVRAKMNEHGLSPTGSADQRTLLRRVYFDLLGLPPTPADIREFLADESPDGFARVVDRLLASPHYGERAGRHWLDVVRYADTAGDGADYPVREAYKYRNYVVRSFNADKPYDEFVREQIAGDLLARQPDCSADRYAELVTATGFLAVSKRFGYNLNTEFQHLDIADTIEGLGRSILGLSIGCARCHDHKYDPLNSADYYSLYGIFASSQFAFPGGEEMKQPRNLVPLLPPVEVATREKSRQDELAKLDVELKRLQSERASLDTLRFAGGVDFGFESQPLGKPPVAPWFTAGPNTITADAQSPFTNVHPAGTRGVRIQHGAPNDGLRQSIEPPRIAANTPRLYFNLDFRNVTAVDGGGAYRLYLGHGAIASLAIECSVTSDGFFVRDGDQWQKVRALKTGDWYHLQLVVDLPGKKFSGRIGRPDDMIEFADKSLASGWDGTIDTFFSDGIGHVAGTKPTHDFDNLGVQDAPFAPPPPASAETAADLAAQKAKLEQLDAAIAVAKKQRDETAARELYELAYGVSEGKPANARIQKRGEPDRLGDETPRRNLEILGGESLPPDAGSGRWQLAEWLTRPTNPLTYRVIVNRVWQQHFGAGLVRTTSDFGTRGEPPTHPELLDELAARFVAGGRSIKSLHRELMLSRTYQLASDDVPQNAQTDPQNRWLWKFARRPLDAESIRDGLLAIGGNLDRTTPTGHPFPPVSAWQFTIHYPFHAVYDSRHRSVYLMIQRARRHPYLALFDAADPNISTAERLPTTTPTQALYLMNDPFVHEQAASFAKQLLAAGDDRERILFAFEATTGREPTPEEFADAIAFLDRYRERLAATSPLPEARDAHAWSALARVLLTSNGFLFVD